MDISEHAKLAKLLAGSELAGKAKEVAKRIDGARMPRTGASRTLQGSAGPITIDEAPANFDASFEGELVIKAVEVGSPLRLLLGLPLGMGVRKLRRQKQWVRDHSAKGARQGSDGAINVPEEASEYEQAQASKLGAEEQSNKFIRELDRMVESELTRRFSTQRDLIHTPVVCIGARLGGEVRAFENAARSGTLALGVDFNPGRRNAYVMWGDAHALRFRNASVGTVYTNILDHLLFYDRFAAEVHRVLRRGGTLFVDMDQKPTDDWASHDLRDQRHAAPRLEPQTSRKRGLVANARFGCATAQTAHRATPARPLRAGYRNTAHEGRKGRAQVGLRVSKEAVIVGT